jgi:glycosyltransferase involved in cell wall biosynthesis
MRIAYVSADLGVPVFGRKGCSIHVQEVVRALRAQGARVELFTMRPEGEPPPGLEAVPVHALPLPPKGDRAIREQAALAANPAVRAVLEREGPFDLVYERYSLWGTAGMDYAREQEIPGFLEVNAPLIDEAAEHRGLADRAGAERVAEQLFRQATALIAVSEEVAAYLRRYPATGDRVHVIPNGVDPERFRSEPEALAKRLCFFADASGSDRFAGTFTVGFVGTMKAWHGLATLVEAFALLHQRVPHSRLLLVGDGPERERLEADLAGRKLRDAALFTGAVAPEAVPGLLASMDVAVAPYPPLANFYFSPMKVYEYMAAGLPVVASRIGQLTAIIRHEETGLLCPPGDAAALAAALQRLEREPAWRHTLGQAAHATVCREHTWKAVAERILGLAGLGTRGKSARRSSVVP